MLRVSLCGRLLSLLHFFTGWHRQHTPLCVLQRLADGIAISPKLQAGQCAVAVATGQLLTERGWRSCRYPFDVWRAVWSTILFHHFLDVKWIQMEGYKMVGHIGDGVRVANYTIWVCPKTGGHEIQWVSQMIFIINKKKKFCAFLDKTMSRAERTGGGIKIAVLESQGSLE